MIFWPILIWNFWPKKKIKIIIEKMTIKQEEENDLLSFFLMRHCFCYKVPNYFFSSCKAEYGIKIDLRVTPNISWFSRRFTPLTSFSQFLHNVKWWWICKQKFKSSHTEERENILLYHLPNSTRFSFCCQVWKIFIAHCAFDDKGSSGRMQFLL